MALTANPRVSQATINDYLRGQEPNILQRNKSLALIKQRGHVTYGHSGEKMDWLVKMDRGQLAQRPDGETAQYSMPERRRTAQLDWGKLEMFERVTKGEKLKNRGKQRRVDLVQDTIKSMMEDLEDYFLQEFFDDGTAVGKVDPLFGLRTILGKTGNSAADYPVQSSSHTYAGLKMNLGGYGGSVQSGSWPAGQFDPKYYFWTPLQANYTRTGFGGSTWAANGPTVLRRLIDYQNDLRGRRGKPDVFLTTATMYSEFKDSQEEKQRITVQRGGKLGLVSLGFTDVMEYDGVEVSPDPMVPSGMAIGLALDKVEICSMQDQLFYTEDDYLLDTKAQDFSIDFWGQIKLNPFALCVADDFT